MNVHDEHRPVPGYESIYEVSRTGRIFSLDRVTTGRHGQQRIAGREINPIEHKSHGYFVVNLAKEGVTRQHRLHVVVARVFVPNPEGKPTVNHEDGVKAHNWADNLTWMTHQEQMLHAAALRLTALGDRNGSTKVVEVMLAGLRDRVLAGELIQDLAAEIGVNRNTITKALTRAFGSAWDGDVSDKRRRAAHTRWDRVKGESA